MQLTQKRLIVICLTFLAAFGFHEWVNAHAWTEYIFVKVPTTGLSRDAAYEGCQSALVRVGTINAENRQKLMKAGVR